MNKFESAVTNSGKSLRHSVEVRALHRFIEQRPFERRIGPQDNGEMEHTTPKVGAGDTALPEEAKWPFIFERRCLYRKFVVGHADGPDEFN